MKLLLDTHAFLWRLLDDPRLPHSANRLIDDVSNELFISSVSAFEIAVKVAIGKLKLPSAVRNFILAGMQENEIKCVPMELRHTFGLSNLP